MKNRNIEHSDNWATPKDFYDKLDAEFHFDFDPCPLNPEPITPDKDGLLIPWGKRNFINPPYSRKLKEAFVLRALEESKKGSLCVLLIPVSTSTALFHSVLLQHPNRRAPTPIVFPRMRPPPGLEVDDGRIINGMDGPVQFLVPMPHTDIMRR